MGLQNENDHSHPISAVDDNACIFISIHPMLLNNFVGSNKVDISITVLKYDTDL
jgi:hypothetical protein